MRYLDDYFAFLGALIDKSWREAFKFVNEPIYQPLREVLVLECFLLES